jgi:hypothetical protein
VIFGTRKNLSIKNENYQRGCGRSGFDARLVRVQPGSEWREYALRPAWVSPNNSGTMMGEKRPTGDAEKCDSKKGQHREAREPHAGRILRALPRISGFSCRYGSQTLEAGRERK